MVDKLVATFEWNICTRGCITWIKQGEDYDRLSAEIKRIITTDLHEIYERRLT